MPVTSITYFTASGQPSFTSTAATVGPLEWIMPFEGHNDKVFFRQRYQQDIDSWTALAMDTPRSVSSVTYLLTKETDFSAIGGGQHQWYRYYATTAPTRTEYTSYSAVFPGFLPVRRPTSSVVPAKITYEYFYYVVTPPALANEARVTDLDGYQTPLLSDIYLHPTQTNPTTNQYITWMSDGTFSITAEQQSLERWEGNFHARKTIHVPAK